MWQAKGGGFYGLGYVVSLLVLEARTLTGDIAASDGVTAFLTSQLVGYVIRFSAESFVNAMLAFAWPMWLFQRLGPWAIPILVGGYLAFEYAGVSKVWE